MSGCAPAHKELMETMQSVYQALKYAFFLFYNAFVSLLFQVEASFFTE